MYYRVQLVCARTGTHVYMCARGSFTICARCQVGDDTVSWGADGARQRLYHGGKFEKSVSSRSWVCGISHDVLWYGAWCQPRCEYIWRSDLQIHDGTHACIIAGSTWSGRRVARSDAQRTWWDALAVFLTDGHLAILAIVNQHALCFRTKARFSFRTTAYGPTNRRLTSIPQR